jgi:long-chain fatty acid transport protein
MGLTRGTAIGGAILAALAAGEASAGAFALREGSAAAQGASLAGRVSNGRDVSFALANPALLDTVENLEVTQGLAAVVANSEATFQSTLPGFSSTDKPGEVGFVPSFALGWRVSPEVVLGLTVDVPFGLATKYDSSFAGSFDAVDSELLTAAFTPMVSWRLGSQLVIGAGLTVLYADANLTNRTLGGVSTLSGDGFGYGATFGLLYEPVSGTRIGARWRSGMDLRLRGGFSDNYTVPIPGVGPVNLDGSGFADISLPSTYNLGVTQTVTPRWRLMAEVEYADWSVYDAIRVTNDALGALQPDEQNYRDSWMFAVGTEYDVTDTVTLRGGVAYDQTPVREAFASARVPDSDKVWLSVGLSWEFTEKIGFDAAYTYLIFTDDPVVTLRNPPVAGRTVTYDSDAHVIGLNARFKF